MEKFYNSVKIEVGIDEAGRGCLAGPVFTGAVILPKEFIEEEQYYGIKYEIQKNYQERKEQCCENLLKYCS